jgi:transcriptional antiterminator RfaH
MWYVARLKAGKQTQALQDFEGAGINVYFPTMRKEVKHFRTKAWISRTYPLFTGYAFADLSAHDLGRVHELRNVLGLLKDGEGTPVPVDRQIVEDLQEAEARGDFDVLRPPSRRLQPGQHVEIKRGALAGHHVSVTSISGKRAIRAVVEILGTMREIEIGIENVRLVA